MAFSASAAAAWLSFSRAPRRERSGGSNAGCSSIQRTVSTPSSISALSTRVPTPAARARSAGAIGAVAAAKTRRRAVVERPRPRDGNQAGGDAAPGLGLRQRARQLQALRSQRRDKMQLFLDTTDTAVLKDLAATGLVDGVTTNPTLIAKSGRNMLEV